MARAPLITDPTAIAAGNRGARTERLALRGAAGIRQISAGVTRDPGISAAAIRGSLASDLGPALDQVAAALQARANKDQKILDANAATQTRLDFNATMSDELNRAQTADSGVEDIGTHMQDFSIEAQEAANKGLPEGVSDIARANIGNRNAEIGANYSQRGVTAQRQAQKDTANDLLERSVRADSINVAQDPALLDSALASLDETLEGYAGSFSKDNLRDARAAGRAKLIEAAETGKVSQDPAHARRWLEFGGEQRPNIQGIADAISIGEGTQGEGGYKVILGNAQKRLGVDVTTMSIDGLLRFSRPGGAFANFSKTVTEDGRVATPMGKYQIVGTTLRSLKKEMGLTGNEIFDKQMQDRMFLHLLNRRGLQKFQAGEITQARFMENLSKEWAGIKNSQRSRDAVTAIVSDLTAGGGFTPPADLDSAAVKRVQRQAGLTIKTEETQVVANAGAERERLDLGIQTGVVDDPAQILDNPLIDDGDKATLLRSLNTFKNKTADTTAAKNRLIGDGDWNEFDPRDRKQVDLATDDLVRSATDPEEAEKIQVFAARKTGIAPTALVNDLQKGINGDDPVAAARSLTIGSSLRAEHQNAFAGRTGGKAVEKDIDEFEELQERGRTPVEAAREMIDRRSTQDAKAREVLRKEGEKLIKDLTADTVMDNLDQTAFFVPQAAQPGIPLIVGTMVQEYREEFENNYERTGDKDVADGMATKQMLRVWGTSNATDVNRFMKFPPENYHEQIDGSHDWMFKQLFDDVSEAMGPDEQGKRRVILPVMELVPTPDTPTRVSAGQPPAYYVMTEDANGNPEVMIDTRPGAKVNQPMVFIFDRSIPEAKRRAEFVAERERAFAARERATSAERGAVGLMKRNEALLNQLQADRPK